MSRRVAAACLALVALSGAACTASGNVPSGARSGTRTGTAAPSRTAPAASGCDPASPVSDAGMGPEVQGTGQGATLYGLIMLTTPMPVRTGQEVKIVWRMTGSGPVRMTATSPQGRAVPLAWGPEPHGGSNYERPGEEWGAGYRFTSAGCWRLHAERTQGSADVWLRVAK